MKRPVSARSLLPVLALLVLTVTAGCSMLTGTESELPSAETVENRTGSIDAIEATVVSTIDTDAMANTSRIRMITRPATGEMRAEVVGDGPQSGTVIVSNGSTMYLYDRPANRVRVIRMNNLSALDRDPMDPVVKIFDALNRAADADQANVSISPLPAVPTGGGAPVAGAQSLSVYGNVTLSYEGMGTVDGRDAYVVEMVPQGRNPIIENGTYWFDEQWYYPIKSTGHMNLSVINGTVSMEYRNVTFNPEISDGTFEFDIPANATVENGFTASNVSSESFDSRGALGNAAETELPNPDVPADYRFETGTLVENGSVESISLQYTNGTESLLVSVRPSSIDGGSNLGDPIEINGHNATIVSIRGTRTVTLRCDERTYGVVGSEPRATIIDIAESIDC